MIRNVKIKKALVNFVFPFFSLLNKILPKDDLLIFIYCANGELNDNSKTIYDYLINNNYNKKYKIVCGAKYDSKYNHKNVKFVSNISSLYYYMISRHVFYSMGKIPIKPTNKQIVINMWHGIPLKRIGLLSNVSNGKENYFSYVCAPSEFFRSIYSKAFGCGNDQIIICGEPKSDSLFKEKKKSQYKNIIWAPTFRQSNYLGYNDSTISQLLPLFNNNEWESLNNKLFELNLKMLVKLHPMQNTDNFDSYINSNLTICSDKYFKMNDLDLFDCLSQSDALITDFSGIFFNYLMLNRPICFAIPDFEEYNKRRGFVFDNPFEYMPGNIAKTKEDLYTFFENISNNIDEFSTERLRINKLCNFYCDSKNTQRIIKLSNLKL